MRTAIVGCGYMASVHIPCLLKVEDVQLAGLCDRSEIRVRELARQHDLPYYTDLARMLDEVQPDVVHILTPPQTHAALATQALQAGCHVFLEKPFCMNVEEATAIIQSARTSGRLVCVDHTWTFSPIVCCARDYVLSKESGQLVHIEYVMDDDFLDTISNKSTLWGFALPGGKFFDLIPHPLYLLAEFMPGIRVLTARGRGNGLHDLRELSVDLRSEGVDAHLHMSFSARPIEHYMKFKCTHGSVLVDMRNYNVAVIREHSLPGPVARLINVWSESWQRSWQTVWNGAGYVLGWFSPWTGLHRLLEHFYRAVKSGGLSPVAPEMAQAVVALSDAVWRQLGENPDAMVPPPASTCKLLVDCAREARSAKLLVTGGTGFIGSSLVERLAATGNTVRILYRPTSRLDTLPGGNVEFAFGDLRDPASLRRAMDGIEVLYHLASARGGDWADYYETSVVGTQNVLDAAVDAGVKKVVYISSMGLLDAVRFPRRGSISEEFPLEQQPERRGNYTRAKLEAERLVQNYADAGKLSVCILRPGLVYGLRAKEELLADAGFRVSEGLVLTVGLGGRRLRLLYVENLVDAMLLAVQSECSTGRVYHIVDSEQPTIREYIREFQRSSGKRLTCLYLPTFVWILGLGGLDLVLRVVRGKRSYLRYRLRAIARGAYCDTNRAREELGWVTRVPFQEAMRRAHNLVRQNGTTK